MMSVSARAEKVKMNYYLNLGMQATQTKMTQLFKSGSEEKD